MATFYYDKVLRDSRVPPATAKEYLKAGLAAEDKALALSPEYLDAVQYKNMLLTLEANKEKDPAVQKQLLGEATKFYQQAMTLRAKQADTPAPAKK
jgi:hypothetical protein